MATEIDIKEMTNLLEKGDGCTLKKEMGERKFNEQEIVFDMLSAEANSRTDNHLSFAKRSIPVTRNGKETGDIIPIMDIRNNDGTLIFQAFKPLGVDAVYGACAFAPNTKDLNPHQKTNLSLGSKLDG